MTGSPHSINDPAVIRDLLTTPATWAVVGLSDNAERTAYRIAAVGRWRGPPMAPILSPALVSA